MDNKNFIKTSIRERILLKILAEKTKINITEYSNINSFEKWDAKSEHYLIESKIRFFNSDVFNHWLIEKSKWDFLKQESKRLNKIPLYINFLKDGNVLIWNLNKILEPKWKINELPLNSQDVNETIIGKNVGYLDIKNSNQIFIKINWLKISQEVETEYKNIYG